MQGCLLAVRRKCWLTFLLVMVLLLVLPFTVFAAEDADHPLVSSESAIVSVDYEVNDGYEWYYSPAYSSAGYNAYLAGNSFTNQANVSNIAFTVTGPGIFSFDYKLSTPSSGSSYALFYNVNVPINSENRQSAKNYSNYQSFRGIVNWTKMEFNITAEDLNEEGQATVYIAYYRGGTNVSNDNMVAIANVCFISGEKTLTLNVDGSDYGYVTDSEGNPYLDGQTTLNYYSGDTVTLTARPEEGGRFYGWVDGSGAFLTTDSQYSFTILADTTLKAVFAEEGSYVAHRNGEFYTAADGGLARALDDAQSGEMIVMLEDQELEEDATVPAGVKLYIPYSENFDTDGNADGVTTSGSPYQASKTIAGSDKTYRTLIIDSNVTLTVNGTINIGGVISYPSQNYQGHTSGWHGKIENNGTIVIKSGGTLDCWGFITGSGTVTAENSGIVYEPFIVYDFAGGSNSYDLYFASYPQSPFKQYAVQNIQNRLVLNYGSTLYVHCNLYAGSKYNKTDITFIGAGGLYQPASGATVTRTYDGTKYVDTNPDIGKVNYIFNGGMTCTSMTMEVYDVAISTEKVDFPIPYNWDIVLENGDYWFEGKLKLMPGATLWVEDNAILRVRDKFYVLDGLIQSDMSGKSYPSTEALQNAGFSASGRLYVNGSMIIEEGAYFGGVIQTQAQGGNPATVTIEEGAVVNSKNVRDGAVGYYDVNTSIFDLPARMYLYDEEEQTFQLMALVPEKTYTSYAAAPWTIDSYTMKYAANCSQEERSSDIPVRDGKYHRWETATVSLNEERSGSWIMNGLYYTLRVINKTAYDPADSTKVAVTGEGLVDGLAAIPAGSEFTFTVTTTEAGKGYAYQVICSTGTGEPVVLSPNAEGVYTISDVDDDVTITVTSCKLGDIFQDTNINSKDLVRLRQILAGIYVPEKMHELAADIFVDGKVNSKDLVRLRQYLAGLYEF